MNNKGTKTVVFTDLDGTLLDEKYGYQDVKPVIDQLLSLNVAIVFCSSKTKTEIEFYRRQMGINDPFISENGSAIFIPRGYFQSNYSFTRQTRRYSVIELGTAYSIIREKLDKVKERSAAEIIGFGDMTEKEIAKDSGLPLKLAKLAKRRQYTEPFRIIKGNERRVLKAIKEENLRFTKGGRYIHLMGNSDKEKAVAILKGLYSQKFDKLKTFGLGDSPNDLSMLKVVDVPIFVKETSRQHKRDAVWKGVLNEIRAHSSEK